jgi:hypothetical protein
MAIAANVVFFLLFAAGGALTLVTFSRNGNSSLNCAAGFANTCAHHSYTLGVALLITGFVGLVLTIAVAGRLGLGFGLRMLAAYQQRRAGTPGSPPAPPL